MKQPVMTTLQQFWILWGGDLLVVEASDEQGDPAIS
jgi:hypothetical protein